MKKTLVIIILAVYIASIAVVNFFGLKDQVFDGVTYVNAIQVTSITVQNENPVTIESSSKLHGIPLYIFDFIPAPDGSSYTTDDLSIISNPNAVNINYEVFPHNADNTSVKFVYDKDSMAGSVVFDDLSKTFIFLRPNVIYTITIESTDGSLVKTQISIMGRLIQN